MVTGTGAVRRDVMWKQRAPESHPGRLATRRCPAVLQDAGGRLGSAAEAAAPFGWGVSHRAALRLAGGNAGQCSKYWSELNGKTRIGVPSS